MTEKERGGGFWGKVALGGCGCALVVAIVIVSLVTWNWPRIRGAASSIAGAISEMQSVQVALQDRFHAESTLVQSAHRSGAPGPILVIELVNAPGMADLPREETTRKAREVAAFARAALKSPDGWSSFEIVLSTRSTAGPAYTSSETFRFTAEDLPPPG